MRFVAAVAAVAAVAGGAGCSGAPVAYDGVGTAPVAAYTTLPDSAPSNPEDVFRVAPTTTAAVPVYVDGGAAPTVAPTTVQAVPAAAPSPDSSAAPSVVAPPVVAPDATAADVAAAELYGAEPYRPRQLEYPPLSPVRPFAGNWAGLVLREQNREAGGQ